MITVNDNTEVALVKGRSHKCEEEPEAAGTHRRHSEVSVEREDNRQELSILLTREWKEEQNIW